MKSKHTVAKIPLGNNSCLGCLGKVRREQQITAEVKVAIKWREPYLAIKILKLMSELKQALDQVK